jgi:hypothetical protein
VKSSRIRLTRLIAFNWYGFRTIVDVDGLTLLCGETGTGKSALLDLIQFVLSAGSAKFNKAAAGENNARSLVGYCLGDTNTRHRDGQPRYLRRSGATIAALEFTWPSTANEPPRRETWGMRIQFESPSAQPSFVRFFIAGRMERQDMCDERGALLSEERFRFRVNHELGGDGSFASHQAFQEEMGVSRHLYFDEKQMRRTLPKAIAFELDTDYQTFIREFILEPNLPDVTNTRRSLAALREAETRVQQLVSQQQQLELIADEDRAYRGAVREAALFGYLRAALDHAETVEKQTEADKALENLRSQHCENLERKTRAIEEKKKAKENFDALKFIVGRDDPQFAEFERLTREQESLAEELDSLSRQTKTARDFLDSRLRAWERWLREAALQQWPITVNSTMLETLQAADTSAALDGLAPLISEFHRLSNKALELLRPIESDISRSRENKCRLKHQLAQLESNRVAAMPLLDSLRGLGIEAQTLGRVIEVLPQGEIWWGIMEALLGEERHAALVQTTAEYVQAQEQWLKLSNPEPLIDPDGIPEQNVLPGSLATFCETAHPVARRFINWRFGQLMAVRHRSELANPGNAVTPNGLVREGPLLLQLSPEKELTLGVEGLRRLREAKEVEHAQVSRELTQTEQRHDALRGWLEKGSEERLGHDDRPQGCSGLHRQSQMRSKHQQLFAAIKVIETPERAARLKKLEALENAVTAADQVLGELKGPLSQFEIQEERLQKELAIARQDVTTAVTRLHAARARLPLGIPDEEIESRLTNAKKHSGSWKQRHSHTEGKERGWEEEARMARERRLIARNNLLVDHSDEFGDFDVKDELNDHFDRRLEEIRKHEVKNFQDLAEERRSDWENRLEEDVLDRLRERLKDAQDTIRDFRSVLHQPIGGYRYVLRQNRDKAHAALWKLLDESVEGLRAGDSLLDYKLREQIEEAKTELKVAVENPQDKRAAALLDYRNYHHYDLEMIPVDHSDDSEGRISLQDRGHSLSGGEGQAPFFVAMLAAFQRVYDLGQRDRQSNLGLVVMDEVFSKLSAGHIADCLALAENFGHQLILAFPMDRLGTMVQHADSIIQCRVKRTADAKGAPVEIINDVIYWKRDRALAEFLA